MLSGLWYHNKAARMRTMTKGSGDIIMTTYDVKRLALVLAIQAEIEAMKVANAERDLPSEVAAYGESHFFGKAQELKDLAAKHDHEL